MTVSNKFTFNPFTSNLDIVTDETSLNNTFLKLDGANQSSWVPTTTVVTSLNADLLDGHHWSEVPSSGGEYEVSFVIADWSGTTTPYEITVTAGSHNQGVTPHLSVTVKKDLGTTNQIVYDSPIVSDAGNVTIYTNEKYNGLIQIGKMGGLLGTISSGGYLTDAPQDGTTYGRNNGSWVEAGGGAGYSPFTKYIEGAYWDNQLVCVGILPSTGSYVLSKVNATMIGSASSTLTYSLQSRLVGSYNITGSTLLSGTVIADADGNEQISFLVSGLNAYDGLFLTTGSAAEAGQVNGLAIYIEYASV